MMAGYPALGAKDWAGFSNMHDCLKYHYFLSTVYNVTVLSLFGVLVFCLFQCTIKQSFSNRTKVQT